MDKQRAIRDATVWERDLFPGAREVTAPIPHPVAQPLALRRHTGTPLQPAR